MLSRVLSRSLTAVALSSGQQAHWSSTKEMGDRGAQRYLPPLWFRDPSITPCYPSVPNLTVTNLRSAQSRLLLLLEISCCFGICNRSVKIDSHHFAIQMSFCLAKVQFCNAFYDAMPLTENSVSKQIKLLFPIPIISNL